MKTTASTPVPPENSESRFSLPPRHFPNLFFDVFLFFTKKLNDFHELKWEWLGLISLGLL